MKIKVERCFSGHSGHFRLTTPDGKRFGIPNPDVEWWRRKDALAARRVLEAEGYYAPRYRFVPLN